ncbi:MAG: response regulator [Actinomycetota bacterium]
MGKGRVLIIDDHELDRKLNVLDLEEAGFRVFEAGNVNDALELLKTYSFDTIVLDIVMPGTDGLTFLRGLKMSERLSRIPVVMLTAKDDIDNELTAMAGGAVRYIIKPSHREVLASTVEAVLEESRKTPRDDSD